MNTKVLFSVFKRNFVGYLSNPTGYVFICVFMLLGSIAAFLPDEFFNANLANLDQLNLWFPLIMLVFVPAITMGIWADERRQGTDELLLTIPASDFDIVLGKYLAAIGIYTASLLFSLVCNLAILRYLGNPDVGLFFCTYFGYWLVGLTMIAIGMVASFVTANLTIAYIFGVAFCAPFIALQWIDQAPLPGEIALLLKGFSIPAQFELFGRGIVHWAGIVYFAMITSTMLYLSMVLIGRRHWTANQRFVGSFHYAVRTLSLLAIGLSLCFFFRQHNLRADMTEEKLSTLSKETVRLLRDLDPEHGVVIEAFLSPDVPESHVQTRLNIVSVLNEIESICGKKVLVRIHGNIQPGTEEALRVGQRYDIKARDVFFESRGRREFKRVFMGISFRCGLRSLSLPFLDRGLSAEYEIIHALCNVTTMKKKRIGILKTDAALLGRFNMETLRAEPPWQIVAELQKQYTIVEVDATEPIKERFDALLAVQPSAMSPAETEHFIQAVRRGQPTVIFEDPFPAYKLGDVAGTSEPRAQASGMMAMMGRTQPKGVIDPLWDFLGLDFDAPSVSWQEYSPIRKLRQLPVGFVFLDRSQEADASVVEPFSKDDSVTNMLQYLMFPFPGRVTKREAGTLPASDRPLTVTTLLRTFQHPAGTAKIRDIISRLQGGDQLQDASWLRDGVVIPDPIPLAVRVRGELPPEVSDVPPILDEGAQPVQPESTRIDVIVVADIDVLTDELFHLRRRGNEVDGINLNFDNVNFVLNAIDSVAGDERFLAVRCRRPKHRTLSKFDKDTDKIRRGTMTEIARLNDKSREETQRIKDAFNETKTQLQKELESGMNEKVLRQATALVVLHKQYMITLEKMTRDLNQEMERAEVEQNESIQAIQGRYKLLAVALPPLPPLLIGVVVMVMRRVREQEGIPTARRRINQPPKKIQLAKKR